MFFAKDVHVLKTGGVGAPVPRRQKHQEKSEFLCFFRECAEK